MVGNEIKVDWKDILGDCLPFSELSEEELERLLEHDATEVQIASGKVIVEEGNPSDHLYILGHGRASVILRRTGGRVIRLATLKVGEMLGEMGLIEDKPRVATVIADERCVLLKIDGPRFLERLHDHPTLQFKMLLTVSERLRNRTEHIFAEQLSETDDRLSALSGQLEAEVRISEATKHATQAMFDGTSKRASEVIESFERTRGYFTWIGTALSGFVAIVVTIVGFLGFDTYFEAKAVIKNVERLESEADNLREALSKARAELDKETSLILDQQNKRSDTDLRIILSNVEKLRN